MSVESRLRILTSLGLGALFALGGSIVAYLLIQAAALFSWPVIVIVFALSSIGALVLDMVTPDR